jgi:hypothetical protein
MRFLGQEVPVRVPAVLAVLLDPQVQQVQQAQAQEVEDPVRVMEIILPLDLVVQVEMVKSVLPILHLLITNLLKQPLYLIVGQFLM